MSAETFQALEEALAAHLLDLSDDKSVILSEWVIFSSSQFMDPSKPFVTSYNWFCHQNMSQSHLLGLIQIGSDFVRDSLSEA